jgi:hypothetical protein
VEEGEKRARAQVRTMHTDTRCLGQVQASHGAACISLEQDKDLVGVTLRQGMCFPEAGPKASQEEVTSFRKPLTAWHPCHALL